MRRFTALLMLSPLACAGPTASTTPEAAVPTVPALPAAAPADSAAPAALPRYTAAEFHQTTRVRGTSFSADETRILITSDVTGVPNVYAQPVAGGAAVPLTQSTTVANRALSYFPNDDRFLFSADGGGDELAHIYVGEAGKAPIDITPGEKLVARFGDWSGDRKSFWISTNERDAQSFDIYVVDVATLKRRMLFKNEGGVLPSAVDPTLRYVAVDKPVDNADSNIYVIDTTARKPNPVLITSHEGKVEHAAHEFSRDGKVLYYSTNAHSEWQQIWTYDLASKQHAAAATADWDVLWLGFSENRKYRTVVTNEDARGVVRLSETATNTPVTIPNLPGGSIGGSRFSRSETKLAFYLATDRTPSDLYLFDIPTGRLNKLTSNLNAAIDAEELVNAEIVRFRSYDGLEVPNVLWKPREASANRKTPVILYIHGGPGGQTWASYRPTIQYLVNHGYGVLAVNNRGSSGYGKTFNHLDDRRHGEADLDDCVAAKRYLQTLDWVDKDKIGIMGASYGGYMTLAALAFRPQEFVVGVDVFGVANWIRTLESIPPWWDAFRNALYTEVGDPKADRERLERVSPLIHANRIQSPLLVIQGANDPRVLQAESDEIVAAVKANGVPVEYVIFDDEGHGFAKRENNIVADEAIKRFLDQHLRG
ncbi:MAG: alpha/beta fold hydrolase [Myxococcales bacterium FL481]|nr:MAG: alpha/beta fold hydrolase [Myxococcales bacterium FL481]